MSHLIIIRDSADDANKHAAVCQDCAFLYIAPSFVEAAFSAALHLEGMEHPWEVFQTIHPVAEFIY